MNKPIKAAVIGAGGIAEEHLAFLRDSQRTELVAICEHSRALGGLAQRRFGAQKLYADVDQMLAESGAQSVHILTPPASHESLAKTCLNADRHILIEKPAALSREGFQYLWKLAESRGLHLVEDHNYRFNRPVQSLLASIAAGDIGRVREVDLRLALRITQGQEGFADPNLPHSAHMLPAGAIHDFITHMSYLMRLFMPEIETVEADWRNISGNQLFRYDDLDARLFGDGIVGRLRFCAQSHPECLQLTIRGEHGYLETDLFQPFVRAVSAPGEVGKLQPIFEQFGDGWSRLRGSIANFSAKVQSWTPYEGLHVLLDQYYESLQQEHSPPISFTDMDGALHLIDRLLAEAKE